MIITILRYFTIDEIQNASQAADNPNNEYSTERKRSAGSRFEGKDRFHELTGSYLPGSIKIKLQQRG